MTDTAYDIYDEDEWGDLEDPAAFTPAWGLIAAIVGAFSGAIMGGIFGFILGAAL